MQVDRVVQVDAGEDGEHVGLQHGDQHLEADQQHIDAEREARRAASPISPAAPSITTKAPNTSSITWPAIMLANSRTESEMRRER